MWVKLAAELGRPLYANLAQVSAVRPPVEGASGSMLALASGHSLMARQSPVEVIQLFRRSAKEAAALWLELRNHLDQQLFVNFQLSCSVRSGSGVMGGSTIAFLPNFTLYAREALDRIEETLAAHPNTKAAGLWQGLSLDGRHRVLVNTARLAAVALPPGRARGTALTFVGGGQLFVTEPPEEVLGLGKQARTDSASGERT